MDPNLLSQLNQAAQPTSYTQAYGSQVQATPSLNPDPYAVATSLNGVNYNSAGDIIGPTPAAPGSTTSGGASGSATTSSVDPNLIAQYDQAIGNTNSAIGRLDPTLQSGYSGIDASYQNALNQLLLGKNQGQQAYDTNKLQTGQNYVGAKNTIGANAGNTLNGLLRLLGSRGAGGGSAYNISAPGAVARGATLQRQDAGNTFGQNNQALDTNWNNFLTGYNNQVSSAGSQKDQQRQSLEQSINTNRATLLQSLAQLQAQKASAAGGNPVSASQASLNQANALLNQNANYTTAPINYQTQAYTAPSLASYNTNPQAAPTFNGQAPTSDYFSPYLSSLLGKKQPAVG